MPLYRADIHVHTLLSPCGDLSMSPQNIVEAAREKGIQLLGIADHNSTRQAPLVRQLAQAYGIMVLCGCEVTTKEEAHVLAFFDGEENCRDFQDFLDQHLPNIPNDTERFGYQIVVDEQEEIVYEEEKLLLSALDVDLNQLYQAVHQREGILIPAHVDKPSSSLTSQLGFVPPDIQADALELSRFTPVETFIRRFPYLKHFRFFQSSDAHQVEDVGSCYTEVELPELTFSAFRQYLLTHHTLKP